MYIREIRIKSFRHIDNVNLGPFTQPPVQSDLVVLAGPNGGGKSSVLELLGYALSSSWSLGWGLGRSFPDNSFEVAIGITPDEIDLIRKYVEASQVADGYDILKYFDTNHAYYRGFKFEEGQYQENATLYNKIHSLVTAALRNHYNRSLGFFLKSDRTYPAKQFDQRRIFRYGDIMKRDHIWGTAFNTSDVQYVDMFEFLVQQRYHYFRRLGAYHHRRDSGSRDIGDAPSDPLKPYASMLQKLFPSYMFTDHNEDVPSNLFVKLPSGDVIPFGDLSSGEKEVFFVLSFFLRHDVRNAVIVIDEPEMHLHPEFARLLLQTMQGVRPGNQIWLATHNTQIIDEAGRDRVIYLARDLETRKSVVTFGTDEAEAMRQLKNMFGYSGYVGIAKSVVFLEGIDSSSDRKMFSSLFPMSRGRVKLVPCGSSENLTRINAAILQIMESNFGWMEFYLIRDRDFLSSDAIQKYLNHSSGKIYVLDRYHIENYLLDEDIIAKVQTNIFNKPTNASSVQQKLKNIAQRISAEVLRDMIAYRLNLIYRPQDFSIGDFMRNQAILNDAGEFDAVKVLDLKKHFAEKTKVVNKDLLTLTGSEALEDFISKCQEELQQALFGEGSQWRALFPGRRLLEEYTCKEGLGKSPFFQNSLIKELSTTPEKIPAELSMLIETITSGNKFAKK